MRAVRTESLLARGLGFLLAFALVGGCGKTRVRVGSDLQVAISAPASDAKYGPGDTVTVTASANNPTGIATLTLLAGTGQIGSCKADATGLHADCTATFQAKDHKADILDSHLTLTATATTPDAAAGQAQVIIVVSAALTTLVIDSPAASSSAGGGQSIDFKAHADNLQGLATLALSAGADLLLRCMPAAASPMHIDCDSSLTLQDHQAQVSNGQLVLNAVATDLQGRTTTQYVIVKALAWGVSFLQPALTQHSPPQAVVHGASPLQIGISGSPTLQNIVVTDEKQHVLATFTTPPFQLSVAWATALGIGTHTLTATGTDAQMAQATATLEIVAPCGTDQDCPSGNRCCTIDGQCHTEVAENAACDCAHPCQTDQGCFTGTCGAPPQLCRPGCNPGSDNPQRAPDDCADVNGKAAFCDPLPPAQSTPQNHGGACAPGDGCDVAAQDCPDYPRDRSRPVAINNPKVPYTCEPVSVSATACFPAGLNQPQDNNTNNHCRDGVEACGNSVDPCVKGYLCVGILNNPGAGLACSPQCNNPGGFCASGKQCAQLYGRGIQLLHTGICI